MLAKEELAKSKGCPMKCLINHHTAIDRKVDAKTLISTGWTRTGFENGGTKVTGECSACRALFDLFPGQQRSQPAMTTLAYVIVKDGMPKDFQRGDVFTDVDGSRRLGRPVSPSDANKTAIATPKQPDWNKQVKAPPPTQEPSPPSQPRPRPAPSPPPQPPSKSRRRRRSSSGGDGRCCAKLSKCITLCPDDPALFQECVRKCQAAPPPQSDAPTSRRRGSRRRTRRRRKAVSLQQLIDEVAAQNAS